MSTDIFNGKGEGTPDELVCTSVEPQITHVLYKPISESVV